MKKAKVRFGYGDKVYNPGDIVPDVVAETYPRLVEDAGDEDVKDPEPEPKNDGTISI